ncbi:MAG: hypothetical protein A3G80_15900 [Betaproteobacteria bacterium RIFCSPLOWO2_12_FULL_62_13b]|nr:MAG: hypothetical protein A3G80_15900 [Betaproteobacteria bacterium RIFCSPLOWO2_12_FULL_62_13b]
MKRIELEVPSSSLGVCNIQEPATGLEAKFSFRAVAAMTLLGDDTGDVAAYTSERVTRAALRELRDRVRVTGRDDLRHGRCVTTVELHDGRRFTASSERPSHPDPAEQRETVAKKYFSLVEPVLGWEQAHELHQRVMSLERRHTVQSIIDLSMMKGP